MKHGTYVGSNPQLWGEKALIRKKWNIVLVQFDNMDRLPLSLTHRWVPFNKTDFIYDKEDRTAS